MANLAYYDIIKKPVVTERSMNDMGNKKYHFYVHPEATKIQIRQAVESMFDGVKVKYVNTLNLKGKTVRRGKTEGKKADRKKAIVQLTEASKEIELFQGM
ncbi:MAG: 50S ribosomal protein L23 [Defluviitaleaceae bacterium]|nr:50S ribosomal protein L23 [Defluviitaleaceae bacterium]